MRATTSLLPAAAATCSLSGRPSLPSAPAPSLFRTALHPSLSLAAPKAFGASRSQGKARLVVAMAGDGEVKVAEKKGSEEPKSWEGKGGAVNELMDNAGVSLGPIGLTISDGLRPASADEGVGEEDVARAESIGEMSTEEWQAKYLKEDGSVDLWVEDKYSAASRQVATGHGSGEGASTGDWPTHAVKIVNGVTGEEFDVDVPEDRYILFEAEAQGYELPYACRMGCCTKCAVKVKSGELYQPQAIGISKELKQQGYALMCVGFPLSDLEIVTQDEDEVYDMQFGRFFEEGALNPLDPNSVERDDFALEIADFDE
eukprot:CAMPEP_0182884346 /NCGR_PEP_ID=MMETSP0034_2-20130328/18936_1 /TAXON_ID=156128 /ORGANISM="Nephroselmis pyriformis, Strain CCMP717" /LENGTH=314 /DNA_ID=CAMNT_0025017533 /DNA_START=23 /DNA_END=967 /DNA_ORIENTATION=+